ncbi:MAG: GAF domain-containing protein, partial [Deltaproteobacteria bacterium]
WAVVKRHGRATQREQKLSCLWETTLTKSDDRGLLHEACAVARDALGADCAAILECVPDQDTLVVRAGNGWRTTPQDKMGRQRGPRSLVTAALAGSGTTTVDDFGAEQRFERPALFREQGVVGAALAVIAGEETPYGLLGVFARRRRSWQPHDLEFLRRVAALVGGEMRRRREVRTLALKAQQSAAEAHVASELRRDHRRRAEPHLDAGRPRVRSDCRVGSFSRGVVRAEPPPHAGASLQLPSRETRRRGRRRVEYD